MSKAPQQAPAPARAETQARASARSAAPPGPRRDVSPEAAAGDSESREERASLLGHRPDRLGLGAPPSPRVQPKIELRASGPDLAMGAVQRALDHTDQGAVGFGGTLYGDNSVHQAWMRTDGTLVGSAPNADPPGYGYIRALQLTNFWIRFHLVNEKAGGPGSARNLVPASKRDNSQYEVNVEQDLKDSVDNIDGMAGDEVFFGVEVAYGNVVPQGASQAQQNAAPLFPTQLTYYHETYDGDSNTWSWETNGGTFDFQDPVPDDPGVAINISAITAQQLRQRVYNYNWDANDVAFIRSLAGTRQAAFEQLIDDNSGLGPAQAAAAALNDIDYSDMTTFGERINDEDAIDALGQAIAEGRVVLA